MPRTIDSNFALVFRFQQMFELKTDIEMVFNGRFAPSGDDNDVLDPGVQRLLNPILNQWFIDNRKHFFGLGFRRWQKPSAQSSGRKYCFSYLCDHLTQLYALDYRNLTAH